MESPPIIHTQEREGFYEGWIGSHGGGRVASIVGETSYLTKHFTGASNNYNFGFERAALFSAFLNLTNLKMWPL